MTAPLKVGEPLWPAPWRTLDHDEHLARSRIEVRVRARCSSGGGCYFPVLRIRKVPSLLPTLV
jgi:hypothetical protein